MAPASARGGPAGWRPARAGALALRAGARPRRRRRGEGPLTPTAGSASTWLLPVARTAFSVTPPRLRGWLSREMGSLRGRGMLAQARAHVPAILATLPPDPE